MKSAQGLHKASQSLNPPFPVVIVNISVRSVNVVSEWAGVDPYLHGIHYPHARTGAFPWYTQYYQHYTNSCNVIIGMEVLGSDAIHACYYFVCDSFWAEGFY